MLEGKSAIRNPNGGLFSGSRSFDFGFEVVGDYVAEKLAVTPGDFSEANAHSSGGGIALRMVRIRPGHLCRQFKGTLIGRHDEQFEFFFLV